MVGIRPAFDILEARQLLHANPAMIAEHQVLLDLVHESNVSYEWIVDPTDDRNGDGIVQYSELGAGSTPMPTNPATYYMGKWLALAPTLQGVFTQHPELTAVFVSLGPLVFGAVPQSEPALMAPPQDGDDIWVTEGTVFQLDVDTARLGMLRYDGTLTSDPLKHVTLTVHTLAGLEHSRLELKPTTGSFKTVFVADDASWADPKDLDRGLITHGAVDIDGAKTPIWGPEGTISGADLTTGSSTDAPEGMTHFAVDYDDMNVVFMDESATPEKSAHVMFMHNPDVIISDAYFEGLGRTRKDTAVTDSSGANPIGRYAVHVHRAKGEEPVLISGVVVVDPTSWGIASHSSYVEVVNSVVIGAFGAAFVSEAGDETGAFRNNIAINTEGVSYGLTNIDQALLTHGVQDRGIAGHGFWLDSQAVSTEGNVAAGFGLAGFVFYNPVHQELDTGQFPPFINYSREGVTHRDNVAFGGVRGYLAHGAGHIRAENFSAWDVEIGVEVDHEAFIDLHGGIFDGQGGGQIGIFQTFGYSGSGSLHNVTLRNWVTGAAIAIWPDVVIEGGVYENNGLDLYFTVGGAAFQHTLLNVPRTTTVYLQAPWWTDDLHRSGLATPALTWEEGGRRTRLYHLKQASDYVPYDSGDLAGLTNRQIFDRHGLVPLGGLAPEDAREENGYLVVDLMG